MASLCSRGMPPLPRSGRVAVVYDAPFIQRDDMVSRREIVVIMRDDDQRSPCRFQFRQDFSVENTAENRVLIGCPLVQHQDWPVFSKRLHQRQTPALSDGKVDGAETTLLQPDLVGMAQPFHLVCRKGQGPFIRMRQVLKQEIIRKNRC